MPDDAVEPREHYVYALYREDGVTPFYIGIGQGRRWLVHDKVRDGTNTHKERIIAKILRSGLAEVPKRKLHEGLTREEACALERQLIAFHGRYPKGPLVNKTSGGDGVADHPEDSREKQREANRRAWADPEKRAIRIANMSANARSVEPSPEVKAAVAERTKAYWEKWRLENPRSGRPPDNRSEWMKEQWRNPETRAMRQAANQKAIEAARSPEACKKRSESLKRSWKNPDRKVAKPREWTDEARAKARALMLDPTHRQKLADSHSPEALAKRSASLRATLATPEAKARRSAALKKAWAERKQEILQKRRETRAAKKLSRPG